MCSSEQCRVPPNHRRSCGGSTCACARRREWVCEHVMLMKLVCGSGCLRLGGSGRVGWERTEGKLVGGVGWGGEGWGGWGGLRKECCHGVH